MYRTVPLALCLVSLGSITACRGSHAKAIADDVPAITTTTSAGAETFTTTMPDVATLAAKVRPAVVNVTTVHTVRTREITDPFDFFGLGPRSGRDGGGRDRVLRQQALGSGFIIDAQGHVVTNAHVVEAAEEVKVKLADEREFEAKVRGRDERLDLAVLELKGAKDLPFVELGDSAEIRVGDYVVAIGNPFGLGQTVTFGIVSAKSRAIGAGPYDDFIQTDASINPGNSGGPLFDMRAHVIGINTAIAATGQGLGFAIPSNALKDVLPQLLSTGHVERGRLGVGIQSIDPPLAKILGLPKLEGALVSEVEKGGPAERAGLKAGDVITGVDGTPIVHARELPRLIARHAPGTSVKLDVVRDKQNKSLNVTLDRLTESAQGPEPGTPGRGEIGVGLSDAPSGGGARVDRVDPSGRAADQLEPGDVITSVNQKQVRSASDAGALIKAAPASEPLLLTVKREGHTRFVAIPPVGH
jgi:serine protease Do